MNNVEALLIVGAAVNCTNIACYTMAIHIALMINVYNLSLLSSNNYMHIRIHVHYNYFQQLLKQSYLELLHMCFILNTHKILLKLCFYRGMYDLHM